MIKIRGLTMNSVLTKRLAWNNGFIICWVSLPSTQPIKLMSPSI